MNERIKDKIEEIEKYISELLEIKPDNLESYINDFKSKAACERYAEVIVEAVIDLAFLSIKEKKLPSPENDLEAFDTLAKNNIISAELADRLKDAKRMRNILAHEYGKVDDEIVFNAIKNELEGDAKDFIKSIKASIKENDYTKRAATVRDNK